MEKPLIVDTSKSIRMAMATLFNKLELELSVDHCNFNGLQIQSVHICVWLIYGAAHTNELYPPSQRNENSCGTQQTQIEWHSRRYHNLASQMATPMFIAARHTSVHACTPLGCEFLKLLPFYGSSPSPLASHFFYGKFIFLGVVTCKSHACRMQIACCSHYFARLNGI